MTNKKKDSLFSRIKSKFINSDDEDDFETIDDELDSSELEDYEARYHGDDLDDGLEAIDDDLSEEEREAILRKELGDDYTPVFNEELMASAEEIQHDEDRTDPSFVLDEDIQETEADQVEEDLHFPEAPTVEEQI